MKDKFTIKFAAFILILYILHCTFYISPVQAAESTQSASPSANIKTKLEELKKEIASKAAKLKTEINQKLQNKAYVGTITSKSESSITVASINGPKIINVNQDSEYTTNLKLKKKLKLEALKEADYIAALGDIDETGVLTAKKIILLPETANQKPKTILWGQIVSISNSQINIKDRALKTWILSTEDTIYQKGGEEIKFSDLKTNNFIIATGKEDKSTLELKFIYVIPTGGVLKPKKTATPSAEIASPSAKNF